MRDEIFEKLKKVLPEVRKNILLRDYTTFKIGGPAEYFLIVKEKNDLMKVIRVAKSLRLPVFIFGGGSNLLVLDKGIRGLVLKIKNKKLKIKNNVIIADAGIELETLVNLSIKKSLQGLEWAGGLPGTFGGAIRGNAGAFGGEIKDMILEVQAFDKKLNLRKLSNKQCSFSYRSSIFKKKNWIVLSASIELKKGDPETNSPNLNGASKKTLREIAESHIQYRKERHPLEYPNAGSIFKNIPFSQFPVKLKNSLLGVVKKDPFPVVPTAHLISEAGLKGARIGGAEVSKKHPNFIVNVGGAKAKDVLKLIDLVKRKIKKVYGIELETEVQIVGK